jgi:MFS family permease
MAFGRLVDDTEGSLMTNLFPVIRASLGLTLGQLALVSSLGRFSRMIFGPLWAMAADRWGKKRVLVFVTGIWGVWTLATGFAQDFTQLLTLYSIGVLGTVAGEPIANALIADIFKDEQRGRAYGTLRCLSSFGSVVFTPVIGQFALFEEGWRYGMFLMGALSMLSGLLMFWLIDDDAPKLRVGRLEGAPRFAFAHVPQLFRVPTFLLLAGNLPMVTILVMFTFMVTFLVDVRGFTTAQANLVVAAFHTGFTLSSFAGGLLGDWSEQRFGAKGRIMLMQAYLLLFALMSYLVFQFDWGAGAALYVVMFLFGCVGSVGFSGVVLPMVSQVVPAAYRSTAFGLLFALLQGLVSGCLSLASGAAAERFGLQSVMLWLVTVPYAVNAFYWTLFYRYFPRDYADNHER